MHHIFKSIYLRQVKVADSCSASQNLSEKYIDMSQCETGVQVKKYKPQILGLHLVLPLSIDFGWPPRTQGCQYLDSVNTEIPLPKFCKY